MLNEQQLNEGENGLEPGSVSPWDKNQKWAVAGLAVFAVLIVILWSVQLKNNIYGPFNSNLAGTNETVVESNQTVSDLALKNKDTDSDGLSDYDELNLYKTSPYLADSDGDSLKDGEEIKNGADPNCPAGRTCANSALDGSAGGTDSSLPASSAGALNDLSNQSSAINNILNQLKAANPAEGSTSQTAGGGTGDLTAEQKQALKNIDAASLRQLLLEAGMDKAALDQISDAELMQSYSETLK